PESNPNLDNKILHVAKMYKKDFTIEDHSFLNIVADEAIFRQLIKCQEKWLYIYKVFFRSMVYVKRL
ncbi:7264_t:CDS:1, partial [Rhizophagus irregularis]